MITKGQKDMTFQKYTNLSVFIMIMYNGKILMPPDFTSRFTKLFETTKTWTKYVKIYISRHGTSGNKRQWPLRDENESGEPCDCSRSLPVGVSRLPEK